MVLSIPLPDGLSLRIADRPGLDEGYPTMSLQKGLVLLDGRQELAEEGVGFGVPILKRGVEAVFPGEMELSWAASGRDLEVSAVYVMNLVERLSGPRGGTLTSGVLHRVKDSMAALHRQVPPLRGPLSAVSAAVRRTFGLQTTFEQAEVCARFPVTYTIDAAHGSIGIAARMTGLPKDVTEVVVMNELGARHFDRYADDDGVDLLGSEIGTWDRVAAARAAFISEAHKVKFSLSQVEDARLSRGRELVGSRLAWAGFGYSLPPARGELAYEVRIERLP